MDYRNVTRSFASKRALNRFKEVEQDQITLSHLYILLAVIKLEKCSRMQLYFLLKKFHRTIPYDRMELMLKTLHQWRWIEVEYKRLYRTVDGCNALVRFEKLLRIQRLDR